MAEADPVGSSASALPEGVVTFLFSDIEGSTKLLHRLGDGYGEVLLTHQRLVRDAFTAHDGREVDTEGDAFFVAFASARQAVAAAVAAQRSLHSYPWPHGEPVRVRMGLHTGEPVLVERKYVGMDVHRAARICSAAHGGQVLLSGRLHELACDRLPEGVGCRDLGEHGLKDLPEPQRLIQLEIDGLPTTFPPVRTQRPPSNLPSHATELVGRKRERAEITALVRQSRLVTVSGPGGVGKTRLVGAVAADLVEHFPHGTFFVDVSAIRDGEDVLPAVARVLGVPVEGTASVDEVLAGHLREQRRLLVLDNVEQVRDADLAIARLLQECPFLHVVVTSRTLLCLQEEQEYLLAPMSLPGGSSLAEARASDAVQLFVECARRARRDFVLDERNAAAVVELCALLDGLPLAIELAAARTRLFAPQALLRRLDDRFRILSGGSRDAPERHRALRATIAWSLELLSDEERSFFRDLGVFDGGARYEDIEAVCAPRGDVLDLLTSLVNHSLVRQGEEADGESRFQMLQTLRDYAREMLEAEPAYDVELRRRHAEHYFEQLHAVTRPGAGKPVDVSSLDEEEDNLRSALRFLLERPDGTPEDRLRGLELASLMSTFWYHHGLFTEGCEWLERALGAVTAPPTDVEAHAVRMLGVMTEQRRDVERAVPLLERARALFRQLGDRAGEARCLNSLGVACRSRGHTEDAERLLLEAVRIREDIHDDLGLTTTRNNLGIIYMDQARWEEAREIFAGNLERDRRAGDDWGAACSNLNLAVAHVRAGDGDRGAPHLHAALTAFAELNDPDGGIEGIEATAGLAVLRGDWTAAVRFLGAAQAAREELELPASPADRDLLDRWLGACREALELTALQAAWKEGAAMTYLQARDFAITEIEVADPASGTAAENGHAPGSGLRGVRW